MYVFEENFSALIGTSSLGLWRVYVSDVSNEDEGSLEYLKIEFDSDPCGNGLLDSELDVFNEDCDDGLNDGIHGC